MANQCTLSEPTIMKTEKPKIKIENFWTKVKENKTNDLQKQKNKN